MARGLVVLLAGVGLGAMPGAALAQAAADAAPDAATTPPDDGIEQGVGIHIDQVSDGRVAASTCDVPDVERVSALRGPQRTLYGKNTAADAITIITRQPGFDGEARAELSVGTLEFVQARASVTGPIIADALTIRLAGSRTRRDDAIFNVATDRDVNQQDSLGSSHLPASRPAGDGNHRVDAAQACDRAYPENGQFAGPRRCARRVIS